MNRRDLFAYVSRTLQACSASAIAIPGVRYLCASLRPSHSRDSTHQRLARLKDLQVGRPLQVAITGRKQDGWLLAESQVIGRVWLVRDQADDTNVQAFTNLCPHMGCQIQLHPEGKSFICPCHRAAFGLAGERLPENHTGERNHAPREMDSLDCRVVHDDASGESWVEVKYEKFEPGLTKKVLTS
jgi:menaquinol-cytochrome c reductase iron-sulfur subunit